jgi:hypothetical protein
LSHNRLRLGFRGVAGCGSTHGWVLLGLLS